MTDGKLKRVLKAQNRTKPKPHQQGFDEDRGMALELLGDLHKKSTMIRSQHNDN